MVKIRNSLLTVFLGAVFALFVGVYSNLSPDYTELRQYAEIGYQLTSSDTEVPTEQTLYNLDNRIHAALLDSRKPLQHQSFRPQKTVRSHGYFYRDGLFTEWNHNHVKRVYAFNNKAVGYPAPFAYGASKDYYVYTLERILC